MTAPRTQTHTPPSRTGKVPMIAYVPPEIRTRFKMLAVEHETSVQKLLIEAIGDHLEKYRK